VPGRSSTATCHETNSIVGRGSIARQQRGTADQQPGPHRTVEILTIRHDISRLRWAPDQDAI
jgi:hypothetical protein